MSSDLVKRSYFQISVTYADGYDLTSVIYRKRTLTGTDMLYHDAAASEFIGPHFSTFNQMLSVHLERERGI